MKPDMGGLTGRQAQADNAFEAFVEREIVPIVHRFEFAEVMSLDLLLRMGEAGYFGLTLPKNYMGAACDWVTYGLLHRRLGMVWSSLRTILGAHTAVAHAIYCWASTDLKEMFLPRLATGQVIAALCLSEPGTGSAAQDLETVALTVSGGFNLTGEKVWITAGQIAGLLLVFARLDDQICAFLVDRESDGVTVTPTQRMMGTRASMLARVTFLDCFVPEDRIVGTVGFGFSHVANTALDIGRYSVACGCAGVAQACVDASQRYAAERWQFGRRISEHQLVQKMLAEGAVNANAAWLMCLRAGELRDGGESEAISQTLMAKYFASRAAAIIASDAVQIHGARGCSYESPVSRHYCDAKIMEIIEGTSQIIEILLSRMV